MFFRLLATIAVVPTLGLFFTHPAHASPLVGVWRAADGSGSARIHACADAASTLCATEIPPSSKAPSAGRVVLKGLRETSTNQWQGTYLMGQDALPATIELRNPNLAEMKVCHWFLCQTVTYNRATN